MKKLKLQLDGLKQMLTNEQMKRVVGGYGGAGGAPTEPTGSDNGGGSGTGYKCCWSGTSTCSDCVTRAKSNWTCVPGATLTAC
jgi:hypothetical protein